MNGAALFIIYRAYSSLISLCMCLVANIELLYIFTVHADWLGISASLGSAACSDPVALVAGITTKCQYFWSGCE